MWKTEQYQAKATAFWDRATNRPRDDIEYFLNFSFFVEHIIRAYVVYINPALNAGRDTESLLYSVGISARSAPKTVEISTLVAFLKRAIPEISDKEVQSVGVLIDFRNTELHDDSSKFDIDVLNKIIPDCQTLVVRLLNGLSVPLSSVLGIADAKQFEAVWAAQQKDRAERIRNLIRVFKDRFYSYPPEEQESRRQSGRPSFSSAVYRSGRHSKVEKCPACAGFGTLSGVAQGSSAPFLKDGELLQETRVLPDLFECKICELVIRNLDELLAAGFAHEFTSLEHVDVVEHFGIDPMDYVDRDDIIREYHDEMSYNDE